MKIFEPGDLIYFDYIIPRLNVRVHRIGMCLDKYIPKYMRLYDDYAVRIMVETRVIKFSTSFLDDYAEELPEDKKLTIEEQSDFIP